MTGHVTARKPHCKWRRARSARRGPFGNSSADASRSHNRSVEDLVTEVHRKAEHPAHRPHGLPGDCHLARDGHTVDSCRREHRRRRLRDRGLRFVDGAGLPHRRSALRNVSSSRTKQYWRWAATNLVLDDHRRTFAAGNAHSFAVDADGGRDTSRHSMQYYIVASAHIRCSRPRSSRANRWKRSSRKQPKGGGR